MANQPAPGQPRRVLVFGVGNVLLSDEGIGVHVARALLRRTLPPYVEVVDAGTAGLELLAFLEDDVGRLIIVDSLDAGVEPGRVFRFRPGDITVNPFPAELSFHDLGILEVLTAGTILGTLPADTVVLGVQPESTAPGLEPSPRLATLVPRLADLVLQEIARPFEPDVQGATASA